MWTPIAGYEGLYEIDENKTVRNVKTWRTMPVNSNAVTLCKQGKSKRVKVNALQQGKTSPPLPAAQTPNRIENMRTHFGPWATPNTTTLIGDAGEHLTCFELAKRGIRCATNVMEGAPYDVIADFGQGKLFTVQVKSCASAVLSGNGTNPSYMFTFDNLKLPAVDLLAFAALDIQKVCFMPSKFSNTKSKRFSAISFADIADHTSDENLIKLYESYA
jgi:hypothetical protein